MLTLGTYNPQMKSFSDAVRDLLGIDLSESQLVAFDQYAVELAEWNQRFNLTSISALEDVRIKHFLDSLSCWVALQAAPPARLIDVGSGAGFPGLPLKIFHPEIDLTLVEATGKKAGFLEHMVQVLRLESVTVLPARAEEVGQLPAQRQAYDWALARALAPLPVLAEYLLPLVKVGGHILAQKGPGAKTEAQAGRSAIEALGGRLSEVRQVRVPGLGEERWLVIAEKVADTPAKYPRRAGMPSKRPLAQ